MSMRRVTVIDHEDSVVCDLCNEEYKGKPDSGGILVGSYAYCPKCAPEHEEGLKKYNEHHLIKARCPLGMPFAKWVLLLRGGDNRTIITAYGGKDEPEIPGPGGADGGADHEGRGPAADQ